MELVPDENSDKRRILSELSVCLKTVYIESSTHNSSQLNLNSALIHCIDRSFQHGLLNLVQGYWPLVRSISHTQTLQTVDGWVGSQSSNRVKSQAWLLATLVEGSLLSYLQCIFVEPDLIDRMYAAHAILRDSSCVTQLSSLLLGVESINFVIEPAVQNNPITDSSSFLGSKETSTYMKPVLDLPLSGSSGLTGLCMTSSMTSSLASPGDSGFTQLDSETDTASFSEVILDADCASVKEEVAVLPVDPCVEKTVGATSSCVPMTVSDIANANTSLGFTNVKIRTSDNALDIMTGCLLSDNQTDDVVFKLSKNKSRKQKRVSFHECTPESFLNCNGVEESCTAEESAVFCSKFSKKELTSSLSHTMGDLSSFEIEQEGVEIAKDSSILGNEGIVELSNEGPSYSLKSLESASTVGNSVNAVKSVIFEQISKHIGQKTPVTERGNPEGQEDPPLKCSNLASSNHLSLTPCERFRMSINSSPAPSVSSLRPQVSTPQRTSVNSGPISAGLLNLSATSILSQPPSKACLVNRFLRSITEKKISSCRSAAAMAALHKNKASTRKLNLFIQGAKPDNDLSLELLDELNAEVNQSISKPSVSMSSFLLVDISPDLEKYLYSHLGFTLNEKICKVLKVWGTSVNENGKGAPLLAVLTDQALYLVDSKMIKHYVMALSNITKILVGPNCQWISVISSEKSFQINLIVGESESVSHLVSSIELSLRRKRSKSLPYVIPLFYEEYFCIPQWIPILKGESVAHYSVVHALEETPNTSSPPLSLDLKAYFMYKIFSKHSESTWEPGYFVLKDGFLFVSLDEDSTPLCILNLYGVKGRFISPPSRPHTIEVGHLHIAAPDDCVAQQWLAAIEKTSSKASRLDTSNHQSKISRGSLILTKTRLILLSSLGIPKFDLDNLAKPLLTAFISDVTSLKIGDKEGSWCVVEFSCREVYESDGDYFIVFSTYSEREAFKKCLWMLNPVLKQNTCTLTSTEAVQKSCYGILTDFTINWNV